MSPPEADKQALTLGESGLRRPVGSIRFPVAISESDYCLQRNIQHMLEL